MPCRIILACVISFFVLSPNVLGAEGDLCKKSRSIVELIREKHIAPREVNDDFSSDLFHHFLENIDPYRIYFTKQDIEKLSRHEFSIDDELNNGNCQFLDELTPLFKKRLQHCDSLIKALLEQPLNYKKDDVLTFEKENETSYAENDEDIKKRWISWMKYLALETMAKMHAVNDEKDLSEQDLMKYEAESRKKIATRYASQFKALLDDQADFEETVAESYFMTLSQLFDPHSMYFSPELEEYFTGSLSKEEKSLGIEFEENETGDLIISRIVPGGPAWESNQIHTGDLLIGIKWKETDWTDLVFTTAEELESMIILNADQVILKVKQPHGLITEVPLQKALIRADDNIIKSFVLTGEKPVGYISLPGFYTEFESQNQLGCANDIAKAILKMQKENIEGLVIDLRNNGGGSLKEAIELAGIFIDFGPLTIIKTRDEAPITIKDINRGSIYNDPVLILVNGQSASASELFSATMQDYKRAVIVGDTTYGKSTGQYIFPLLPAGKSSDPGFVKVTNCIFYRLNGISYQQQGVVPDITLPILYAGYEDREKDADNPLHADPIEKKVYMPAIKELPYQTLLENSIQRVSNDSTFNAILDANNTAATEANQVVAIPLSLSKFVSYKNDVNSSKNSILGKLKKNKSAAFNVNEVDYDRDLLKMDDFTKEINQVVIQKLEKDIYLEEAYRILMDLINLN
ncbi:MAG: carboxy terminal-processing peptidase [Flavobacteriales bacterium]|nr:carboxy terminal-processing peptidase [Flavobacteriales bacterium]